MQISFALFIFLSLTTVSWRYGTFAWLPLIQFDELVGGPMRIGVFNLLPILVVGSWGLLRWQSRRKWQWGYLAITAPMLALTVLNMSRLTVLSPRRIFLHLGGWAIAWLVYLFVLNESKRGYLSLVLSLILIIQGGVALAQFGLQQDVGLVALGELPLNPAFPGVTVLFARNVRWLRAYGLTAHPNLLGAILAILLLIQLVDNARFVKKASRFSKWQKHLRQFGLVVGTLGLFVSFSRSAWLGFGVGVLIWGWRQRPSPRTWGLIVLPILIMLIFYHDLATSRLVGLETAVESRSLDERVTDTQLALDIIRQHPLWGVGMDNYTDFAQTIEPSARRVHNVPLLIIAETGVLGGLLWLTLALAPLMMRPKVETVVWIPMIIMSQFDTMVWVSGNWQTAVMFALLAATASCTSKTNVT